MSTNPKPFVFVLMPFVESMRPTYEIVRGATEAVGGYCERVEEQHFDGSIVDRIYNQILHADVIVAVMTGRNPNVFYETGYAHALGKRTILVASSLDDVPFDLADRPHVLYRGDDDLKAKLTAKLDWAVRAPPEDVVDPLGVLTFHSLGTPLVTGTTLLAPIRWEPDPERLAAQQIVSLDFELSIDIQNPTLRSFDASGVELALEVDSAVVEEAHGVVRLPHGRSLISLGRLAVFLPGSWQSRSLPVRRALLRRNPELLENVVLHVYSRSGTVDIAFSVCFAGAPP